VISAIRAWRAGEAEDFLRGLVPGLLGCALINNYEVTYCSSSSRSSRFLARIRSHRWDSRSSKVQRSLFPPR
jgi:hypothetical protein